MIPSAVGRLFAAVLVTISFVAACSGAAATPASSAAALYLAAATAVKEAGEANDAAYTPEEIVVGYRNYARALTDAVDTLSSVEFPAAVQADVDTLIGLYATSAGEWAKLADNPGLVNEPAYEAPLLTTETYEQMTAVDTRIRAALGLPRP